VVGFVEQYATAPITARRRFLEDYVSFQYAWRRRSVELRANWFSNATNGMAALIPIDPWGCFQSDRYDGSVQRRENGNASVETSCGAI
jgi:hypothetical protein